MGLQRREKEQLVAELHEKFKAARALILTDFTGLEVAQLQRLREQLRQQGVEYRVVKNTLLRLASRKTAIEALAEHFVGPNAIVLSYEDPVQAAKVLVNFHKEEPDLQIKAGFVEGKVLGSEEVKALASLPGRDVLLGKLLGGLKSLPTRLVFALKAPLHDLVRVLKAIEEAKGKS